MTFTQIDNNTAIINDFRIKLYQQLDAPIDGMWEVLYIGYAQHYLIENDGQNIGYCCIGEKSNLTQIFLIDKYNHLMNVVIRSLIESKIMISASLSSIEPISFNACLAESKSIQTNTFCFQHSNRQLLDESSFELELASIEDTQTVKDFLMNQIGFDDNFGYTKNLIQRKEQYFLKKGEIIIATGECRLSDSQSNIADLGVIVNKDYQNKGLGAQILRKLVTKAKSVNRKPICSTTVDNISSKKAIERAGFYCSHIIFDMNFLSKG